MSRVTLVKCLSRVSNSSYYYYFFFFFFFFIVVGVKLWSAAVVAARFI